MLLNIGLSELVSTVSLTKQKEYARAPKEQFFLLNQYEGHNVLKLNKLYILHTLEDLEKMDLDPFHNAVKFMFNLRFFYKVSIFSCLTIQRVKSRPI